MSGPMQSRVTRRGFLAAGVVTGVGAFVGGPLASAAPPAGSGAPSGSPEPSATAARAALRLIVKAIPATGEALPAIGIGTDSFRSGLRDDIRTELGRMSELGATVIDTSDDYGDSEALIGEALARLGTRDRMFLATKISGGGAAGATSLARSLER